MAVDTGAPSKQSWADEIEDEEGVRHSVIDLSLFETSRTNLLYTDAYQTQVFTDENGIKTIIDYRENDDGKRVKVTRKIRSKLVTEHVNKAVAQRKKWAKFGEEEGNKPGPDMSTTTIGENIPLKLGSTAGKTVDAAAEEEAADKLRRQLKPTKNIMCRICKGEHFTSKCPYKDTLQPLDEIASSLEAVKLEGKKEGWKTENMRKTWDIFHMASGAYIIVMNVAADAATADVAGGLGAAAAAAGGSGKYVPVHLRNKGGAAPAGESMRDMKRDDTATLRVTNLSEDVMEEDIRELFGRFGHITRVFLARDRDTGLCKGFAFVSFADRDDAEKAQGAVNGRGYDNLILRVEFARST
ncbi:eukaryotic translation initiation factor 3 subunit G-domain-containing protein [Radiomyces spectabilis]|uniref:eukaryotic translation initiation factor 3 subunit G-domain-containing protein n=1 Tax=Radiomyces spectabilis TaxID=64574 RepID=UPI00221EFA37|nr:eukaryotic translation initiation factor 3 subunit G-domain-containing protein [Radiomyces spectabilis]KAI8376338.1 eukaryotic translation initiation factor 3 subunit G-domain-containing protein [Radiomyces spectabilis]